MAKSSETTPKSVRRFIIETGIGILIAGLLTLWFGQSVGLPFGFGDVFTWGDDYSIFDGLANVWYIFAWGALVTAILGAIAIAKGYTRPASPGVIFLNGVLTSLIAGIFEELRYRWAAFFFSIFGINVLNLLWGIPQWFYENIAIPFSNLVTFGILDQQLAHATPWLIGAAIVSANGDFQEQHKYLGKFGYINSWFIGMIMFYLMFNYGLLTAIVAHILYDLVIFGTRAIVALFQKDEPDLMYLMMKLRR